MMVVREIAQNFRDGNSDDSNNEYQNKLSHVYIFFGCKIT